MTRSNNSRAPPPSRFRSGNDHGNDAQKTNKGAAPAQASSPSLRACTQGFMSWTSARYVCHPPPLLEPF